MSVVKACLKTNHDDYDLALCLLSFIQFVKQINQAGSSRLGFDVRERNVLVGPSLPWIG